MNHPEISSNFPPDDEKERHINRKGALKPLNNNQKEFIVRSVIEGNPVLVSKIEGKLVLPDEEKGEEYLGDEVIEFDEFCGRIGANHREYNTSPAFVEVIDLLRLKLNRAGE